MSEKSDFELFTDGYLSAALRYFRRACSKSISECNKKFPGFRDDLQYTSFAERAVSRKHKKEIKMFFVETRDMYRNSIWVAGGSFYEHRNSIKGKFRGSPIGWSRNSLGLSEAKRKALIYKSDKYGKLILKCDWERGRLYFE